MSKYLLLGDIHLSDRPPSICTDDYLEDLFVILEHTIGLETELGVDGVIWSGDVFHHRQANRTSHRTVQRAIEIVQAYRNLWIVPGNHDLASGDRLESVSDTQPLGVLFKAGAKLLQGWESTGQHPIYGVPWQQHWTDDVVREALANWVVRFEGNEHIKRSEALIVAHAPLYPPGMELEWENYPTPDWGRMQGAGSCYYGHVHEAHGTYQVGDVTFCNQGAITRGSLHESELNRAIAVTTWSPEEGFVRVDVPHKPADEVFKLMLHHERQDARLELDTFLSKAGAATLEVASIEAIVAHIKTLDLEPAVIKLAEELLASGS